MYSGRNSKDQRARTGALIRENVGEKERRVAPAMWKKIEGFSRRPENNVYAIRAQACMCGTGRQIIGCLCRMAQAL